MSKRRGSRSRAKKLPGHVEALLSEVRVRVPPVRVSVYGENNESNEYFDSVHVVRADNQFQMAERLRVIADMLGSGVDPGVSGFAIFIGTRRAKRAT